MGRLPRGVLQQPFHNFLSLLGSFFKSSQIVSAEGCLFSMRMQIRWIKSTSSLSTRSWLAPQPIVWHGSAFECSKASSPNCPARHQPAKKSLNQSSDRFCDRVVLVSRFDRSKVVKFVFDQCLKVPWSDYRFLIIRHVVARKRERERQTERERVRERERQRERE